MSRRRRQFFTLPLLFSPIMFTAVGCAWLQGVPEQPIASRRREVLEDRNRLRLDSDETTEERRAEELTEEPLINPTPASSAEIVAVPVPLASSTGATEVPQHESADTVASTAPAAPSDTGNATVARAATESVANLISPGTPPHVAAALRCVEQGRLLLEQQRTEAAREWFERALTLDGNNPYAYYFLARAAMQAGRLDQAEGFLSRAVTLSHRATVPWQSRVLSQRGEVLEAIGRFPEARQAYRQAATLDPNNLQAQTGLARLAQPQ